MATVEDLASRRLPGFAIGERHDAELAAGAIKMAAAVRGGDVRGVIFHSDRGSDPASKWKTIPSAVKRASPRRRVNSACSSAAMTNGDAFDDETRQPRILLEHTSVTMLV
jgi:transposase InsO family protein